MADSLVKIHFQRKLQNQTKTNADRHLHFYKYASHTYKLTQIHTPAHNHIIFATQIIIPIVCLTNMFGCKSNHLIYCLLLFHSFWNSKQKIPTKKKCVLRRQQKQMESSWSNFEINLIFTANTVIQSVYHYLSIETDFNEHFKSIFMPMIFNISHNFVVVAA